MAADVERLILEAASCHGKLLRFLVADGNHLQVEQRRLRHFSTMSQMYLAFTTLRKLAAHDLSEWAITGGWAVEIGSLTASLVIQRREHHNDREDDDDEDRPEL